MKVEPGEILNITLIKNYELFKNSLSILEDEICFVVNWVEYKVCITRQEWLDNRL